MKKKWIYSSDKVSGILLCSVVWFNSIPGVYTATNTGRDKNHKKKKRAHGIEVTDHFATGIRTGG